MRMRCYEIEASDLLALGDGCDRLFSSVSDIEGWIEAYGRHVCSRIDASSAGLYVVRGHSEPRVIVRWWLPG
jgi:hypothetical protein